jgi:TolA-binding protein
MFLEKRHLMQQAPEGPTGAPQVPDSIPPANSGMFGVWDAISQFSGSNGDDSGDDSGDAPGENAAANPGDGASTTELFGELDFATLDDLGDSIAEDTCSVSHDCDLGTPPPNGARLEVITRSTNLNFRRPENVNQKIGNGIPKGATVTSLEEVRMLSMVEHGREDAYLLVEYNGEQGFVHAGYLGYPEVEAEGGDAPEGGTDTPEGTPAEGDLPEVQDERANDLPGTAEENFDLGIQARRNSDFELAVRHLEEAVRLNDRYIAAYDNLGLAQYNLGNVDEAINNYRRAIEVAMEDNVQFEHAYRNLGDALLSQEDYQGALDAYDEAVRIVDNSPSTHRSRARALNALGRPDEDVVEALRRAQEIESN